MAPDERPAGPVLGTGFAFGMSAWFGLVVGSVELGLSLAMKPIHDPSPGLFRMNRHILWSIPLMNLVVFGVAGALLALRARIRPGRSPRASAGVLGTLAGITLLLTCKGVYTGACVVLGCGFGYRVGVRVDRHFAGFRRLVSRSLPALAVAVLILIGLTLGRGLFLEHRALANLPPAAPGAPNVLLIVLDTVRADRLSLYGYDRETTPNLARLARLGIRFDQARSTAPWTLPSHSTMMTGRWPHENSAHLHGPLDGRHATLAESLAGRGYATAGFVANTTYCAAETGLARGFAHYEDHDLSPRGLLRTSALGKRVLWKGLVAAGDWLGCGPLDETRKQADQVNHDLLAWLDGGERRPFFAFLNYVDAHSPYILPDGFDRHFGIKPESRADLVVLDRWFTLDKSKLPKRDLQLASDAYDDCIAFLDEQLGHLFEELGRRGILDRTLVIVTADHGEHFGEHQLYCHGASLYDPEVHVPLLVVPPGGLAEGRTVAAPVSLRDLAATVAELAGLGAGSPFPGRSLARYWEGSAEPEARPLLSEVDGPSKSPPNLGRSPAFRGAMKSLLLGRELYIRNGDGVEEVYDLAADPGQRHNRRDAPEVRARLSLFRDTLERMTEDDPRPLRPRAIVAVGDPAAGGLPARRAK